LGLPPRLLLGCGFDHAFPLSLRHLEDESMIVMI
jgi:hypothetical protein